MQLFGITFALLATSGTLCLAAKGIKTVVYVDLPMHNSLPDLPHYKLAGDGQPVVDIAIISQSVIKKNNGKVVAVNPPGTQDVLDNADKNIRPLQAQNIKVLLSLTGDCDGVGISSFTNQDDIDFFANSVKDIVTKYNLDGVDLDDEYNNYQGADNDKSAVRVINALRDKMPNKIISLFDYCTTGNAVAGDDNVYKKLNYAWNPIYGTFQQPAVPNLDKKFEAAAAVEAYDTTQKAGQLAQMTKDQNFGAFVIYSLYVGDRSDYLSQITQKLYGQKTKYTGSNSAASVPGQSLAAKKNCGACPS